MATAYTFTYIKGSLQIPDAFANALDVLQGQIPARDRVDQTWVVVVEHTAKTAFTDEAALRQSIAHSSEMLIFDGELRFALRSRIIVVCGVLQRAPSIMVTTTTCAPGVAEAHARQHAGRMCGHLQTLHGVEILTGLRTKLRRQSYGPRGEQIAQTTTVRCGFNQLEHRVIIAKGEGT